MNNPNPVGSQRFAAWQDGFNAASSHTMTANEKMQLWFEGYSMEFLEDCIIPPKMLQMFRSIYTNKLLFKEFRRGLKAYVKQIQLEKIA